ncbi:AAA family ATPase [Alphaproteobacteria bacterium]|nr:AAA family ATPase [Alphaproteobacteria bacterium]
MMSGQGDPESALFAPMIGHDAFERQLAGAKHADRLHHAWLLTGPKGIGKSVMARRAAAWLLSENTSDPLFGDIAPEFTLDYQDPGANQVIKGAHPDLLLIQPDEEDNKSGQIKINQIRSLLPFMMHKPGRGGYRVAIIDSMDEVNRNGANAMLKLLEEPPENTVIFLVSSRPGQLPPTIRSRCRVVRMNGLENDACRTVLRGYWPDADDSQIDLLTALSEGAPGRAIMLADSGAADCYQAACSLLAEDRLDVNALATICGKWGQGTAAGRLSRLGAIMLVERLLRLAALQSAGNMPNQEPTTMDENGAPSMCRFEERAITRLRRCHAPDHLALMQAEFTSEARKAEALYTDFAHFLLRQFAKFHEKTLP